MRILIVILTALALPAAAHDITYPKFDGRLNITGANDTTFLDFASEHKGQVVYLDLYISYSFGVLDEHTVNEACNLDNDYWNDGFTDNRFVMPLDIEYPDGRDLSVDEVTCAELPITFTGVDLQLSSGGPGAHWYEVQGFFLMRERTERWPYLELKWLDANAETWAGIVND